jgi:Rap/ran-GAP/Domain of unknown function (DUF3384)
MVMQHGDKKSMGKPKPWSWLSSLFSTRQSDAERSTSNSNKQAKKQIPHPTAVQQLTDEAARIPGTYVRHPALNRNNDFNIPSASSTSSGTAGALDGAEMSAQQEAAAALVAASNIALAKGLDEFPSLSPQLYADTRGLAPASAYCIPILPSLQPQVVTDVIALRDAVGIEDATHALHHYLDHLQPGVPDRLTNIVQICLVVRSKPVEEVNTLWSVVADLVTDPAAANYAMLVLCACVEGQFERLNVLRFEFFNLIRDLDISNDCLWELRLHALYLLTRGGEQVVPFGNDVVRLLVDWVPKLLPSDFRSKSGKSAASTSKVHSSTGTSVLHPLGLTGRPAPSIEQPPGRHRVYCQEHSLQQQSNDNKSARWQLLPSELHHTVRRPPMLGILSPDSESPRSDDHSSPTGPASTNATMQKQAHGTVAESSDGVRMHHLHVDAVRRRRFGSNASDETNALNSPILDFMRRRSAQTLRRGSAPHLSSSSRARAASASSDSPHNYATPTNDPRYDGSPAPSPPPPHDTPHYSTTAGPSIGAPHSPSQSQSQSQSQSSLGSDSPNSLGGTWPASSSIELYPYSNMHVPSHIIQHKILSLILNVIKSNFATIGVSIMYELVHSICQRALGNADGDGMEFLQLYTFPILEAVSRYGTISDDLVGSVVPALCMGATVSPRTSWAILRQMLLTEAERSDGDILRSRTFATVARILDSSHAETESDKSMIRGAVYFVTLSSWGPRKRLLPPLDFAYVLPHLRNAISCKDLDVVYEVLLSLRRLVRKYGATLWVEWELVVDILHGIASFVLQLPASGIPTSPMPSPETVSVAESHPSPATTTPSTIDRKAVDGLICQILREMDSLVHRDALGMAHETFIALLELYQSILTSDLRKVLLQHIIGSIRPTPFVGPWLSRLVQFVEVFVQQSYSEVVQRQALGYLNHMVQRHVATCSDLLLPAAVWPCALTCLSSAVLDVQHSLQPHVLMRDTFQPFPVAIQYQVIDIVCWIAAHSSLVSNPATRVPVVVTSSNIDHDNELAAEQLSCFTNKEVPVGEPAAFTCIRWLEQCCWWPYATVHESPSELLVLSSDVSPDVKRSTEQDIRSETLCVHGIPVAPSSPFEETAPDIMQELLDDSYDQVPLAQQYPVTRNARPYAFVQERLALTLGSPIVPLADAATHALCFLLESAGNRASSRYSYVDTDRRKLEAVLRLLHHPHPALRSRAVQCLAQVFTPVFSVHDGRSTSWYDTLYPSRIVTALLLQQCIETDTTLYTSMLQLWRVLLRNVHLTKRAQVGCVADWFTQRLSWNRLLPRQTPSGQRISSLGRQLAARSIPAHASNMSCWLSIGIRVLGKLLAYQQVLEQRHLERLFKTLMTILERTVDSTRLAMSSNDQPRMPRVVGDVLTMFCDCIGLLQGHLEENIETFMVLIWKATTLSTSLKDWGIMFSSIALLHQIASFAAASQSPAAKSIRSKAPSLFAFVLDTLRPVTDSSVVTIPANVLNSAYRCLMCWACSLSDDVLPSHGAALIDLLASHIRRHGCALARIALDLISHRYFDRALADLAQLDEWIQSATTTAVSLFGTDDKRCHRMAWTCGSTIISIASAPYGRCLVVIRRPTQCVRWNLRLQKRAVMTLLNATSANADEAEPVNPTPNSVDIPNAANRSTSLTRAKGSVASSTRKFNKVTAATAELVAATAGTAATMPSAPTAVPIHAAIRPGLDIRVGSGLDTTAAAHNSGPFEVHIAGSHAPMEHLTGDSNRNEHVPLTPELIAYGESPPRSTPPAMLLSGRLGDKSNTAIVAPYPTTSPDLLRRGSSNSSLAVVPEHHQHADAASQGQQHQRQHRRIVSADSDFDAFSFEHTPSPVNVVESQPLDMIAPAVPVMLSSSTVNVLSSISGRGVRRSSGVLSQRGLTEATPPFFPFEMSDSAATPDALVPMFGERYARSHNGSALPTPDYPIRVPAPLPSPLALSHPNMWVANTVAVANARAAASVSPGVALTPASASSSASASVSASSSPRPLSSSGKPVSTLVHSTGTGARRALGTSPERNQTAPYPTVAQSPSPGISFSNDRAFLHTPEMTDSESDVARTDGYSPATAANSRGTTPSERLHDPAFVVEPELVMAMLRSHEAVLECGVWNPVRLGVAPPDSSEPVNVPPDVPVSFLSAISELDSIPPKETVEIGVLYIAPNQKSFTEVLGNTQGSALYERFLHGLGEIICTIDSRRFLGGLDSSCNEDGHYALVWHDELTDVCFHTSTLIPPRIREFPDHDHKVSYIGSDEVVILYDDGSFPESELDQWPSQRTVAFVVVTCTNHVADSHLFLVRTYKVKLQGDRTVSASPHLPNMAVPKRSRSLSMTGGDGNKASGGDDGSLSGNYSGSDESDSDMHHSSMFKLSSVFLVEEADLGWTVRQLVVGLHFRYLSHDQESGSRDITSNCLARLDRIEWISRVAASSNESYDSKSDAAGSDTNQHSKHTVSPPTSRGGSYIEAMRAATEFELQLARSALLDRDNDT